MVAWSSVFRSLLSCSGLAIAQDLFLKRDTEAGGHDVSFSLQRQTSEVHALGYTVHKSTYLSAKMSLAPGEMVFTPIHKTPITMPSGRYAILNFSGEIVDKDEQSVPLDVVYNHHWIVRTLKVKPHVNQLCKGLLNYNFGIGAESRNRPNALPAGYGLVVEDGEEWGANIHLLHTEDLSGPAKECVECWYAPGKGSRCTKDKNGTFDCCGELCAIGQCQCPTTFHVLPRKKSDYYLKYDVYWTPDVDQVVPVDANVLAAPNCKPEYNVFRNNAQPERVDSHTWTAPIDTKVVLAQGHLHTGSLNISMYKNGKFICASVPRYGTEPRVAGNELGHLVDVTPCIDESTGPLTISKGDTIRIDGWYYVGDDDSRVLPGEGGSHLGVMSYMEFFSAGGIPDPDVAKCQQQLIADGCKLSTGSPCYQCGTDHTDDLTAAGCTTAMVKSLCAPAM